MKKNAFLLLILLGGHVLLFAQERIVEPHLSYLPAQLDSTIQYSLNAEGLALEIQDKRVYKYNADSILISAEIKSRNSWRNDWNEPYGADGDQTEFVYYGWSSETNDWVKSGRKVWTFDDNGNRTEYLGYGWSSVIHDWINSEREVWTYDTNGNQAEYIVYDWDSEINDWLKNWQRTSTYDENGNRKVQSVEYEWDSEIDEWVVNWFCARTYDANGNETAHTDYDWDYEINDWVMTSRETLTYDEDGNRTERVYYHRDSEINDWVVISRDTLIYNEIGNRTERVYYHRDSEINDWVVTWLDTLTYDENGNQTEYASYYWSADINDWVKNWHWTSTYDEDGNQTEYASYYWSADINDWVKNWHWTSTYDGSGNQTEYIEYHGDSIANNWVMSRRKTWIFDIEGKIRQQSEYSSDINSGELIYSDMQIAYWSDATYTDYEKPYIMAVYPCDQSKCFSAISSKDGVVYLVPEGTEKELEVIRKLCVDSALAVALNSVNISSGLDNGVYWLYASDFWKPDNISDPVAITVVGIEKSLAPDIKIYPNPTYNFLTIETGTSDPCNIEIMSLSGQLILSKGMEGNLIQIDLTNFKKGIYFINIRSEDSVSTSKIIKL